jgi:hypothetical protein
MSPTRQARPATRFERIRQALGRIPAHGHDPAAAHDAARTAAADFSDDERLALCAIADHPCTALELGLVFPHWPAGHAAKRLSELKNLGLVDTGDKRRLFPGRSVPSHVYTATRHGRLCADEWPHRQNGPVAAIVARGLERLTAADAPADDGRWPCLYCPVRSRTHAGAVLHEQRAHGIPRLDPHTLRPINESDAA